MQSSVLLVVFGCLAVAAAQDVDAIVDETDFVEKIHFVEPLPKESPVLITTDQGAVEDVLKNSRGSPADVVKSLVQFRAYCLAAHNKAVTLQASNENTGTMGSLLAVIIAYGKPIPRALSAADIHNDGTDVSSILKAVDEIKYTKQGSHDNIVVDFAQVMGSARALYTSGLGKYMLDKIDTTMMAGTDIVVERSHDGKRIMRLSSAAMGLTSKPLFFDTLAVDVAKYHTVSAQVIEHTDEATSTVNAAKLWLRHSADVHHSGSGGTTVYNSFTTHQYSSSTNQYSSSTQAAEHVGDT